MFKKNKLGIIESPTTDVGNNKNNKEKVYNKSVNKFNQKNNINNYNFLVESVSDFLSNKEIGDKEKWLYLIKLINEKIIENSELKQKFEVILHLSNNRKDEIEKLKEIKNSYEKDKEKWESTIEENYIIIKKSDNVIFEFKTYLKNTLKENYDKLVNSVKIDNDQLYNKTVIIINKNKCYGGKNDIDILIKKWLENKILEEHETENFIEENIDWEV